MRIYLVLSNLGWPRSYLGKFLLISFLGVHVPLIGGVAYLLLAAKLPFAQSVGVLLALLVATVVGASLTMTCLYALLAPVREAARAINGYLREKRVPQLPTQIVDDAGVLMANIQEAITRLDAALDATRSQLAASEVSARGKFELLSAMSHELRTPLNHIIGFAEMMSTEALGPLGQPKYRGYAANIGESGGQLLTTLQVMLELTELSSAAPELAPRTTSLDECMRGAAALVHLNAQTAGIELEIAIPASITAYVDPRAMKQILLHTLQGAIDAGLPNEPIRIAARQSSGVTTIEVAQQSAPLRPDDVPPELRSKTMDVLPYGELPGDDREMASASTHALRLSLLRSLLVASHGDLGLACDLDGTRVVRLSLPSGDGAPLAAAA